MAAKKEPRGALWGCGRGGQSDGHSGVKETGDGWRGRAKRRGGCARSGVETTSTAHKPKSAKSLFKNVFVCWERSLSYANEINSEIEGGAVTTQAHLVYWGCMVVGKAPGGHREDVEGASKGTRTV